MKLSSWFLNHLIIAYQVHAVAETSMKLGTPTRGPAVRLNVTAITLGPGLFGSTPCPIPSALAKIFSERDKSELQKGGVLHGENLALSTARSQNQRLPHTLAGYAAQQSPDN